MKKIVIGAGVLCALAALVILTAGCVGSDITGDWVFDSSPVSSSMIDKSAKLHIDADGTMTSSNGNPNTKPLTGKWKKQSDGTYIVPELLATMELVDGKLKVSMLGMEVYYKRA